MLVYQSVACILMPSTLGAGYVTATVVPATSPMSNPINHTLGRRACRSRSARRPEDFAAIMLSPVELFSPYLAKIVALCELIWVNCLCTYLPYIMHTRAPDHFTAARHTPMRWRSNAARRHH